MTIKDEILENPSTSFWLKEQIRHLKNRDLVDALNDVEALAVVINDMLSELIGKSSKGGK